jgi:hypothetical protein
MKYITHVSLVIAANSCAGAAEHSSPIDYSNSRLMVGKNTGLRNQATKLLPLDAC